MEDRSTRTSEPNLEQWLRATHTPAHARRTAARNAAFLLPHLKPGMELLDAGCGPGSITLGLAEAVAPGSVVGIDANAGVLDGARALAAERGVDNVRFDVADISALPFDDASFDAAFIHAVLQHLPDPLAAVREIRRVLRPGGVIGVADADHDGALIAPDNELIRKSMEIVARMKQGAFIGKHLRELLHEAGFVRIVGSASAAYDGTEQAIRFAGEWQARYHEAPAFIENITGRGWATPEELAAMADAWRAWGNTPGAFAARFACEALGWVPESE